jgi:3-hydroxymyristoyl/3-hydroxydecanoyl-(acyl carrier protein) dehydratase
MIPALTSEGRSGGELRWTFTVPVETPFFGGHFPEHPILPGVVALAWMLSAAERLQGRPLGPVALLNTKFQVVIEPGARLELTLTPRPPGHLLGVVRSEAGIHASTLIPIPVA